MTLIVIAALGSLEATSLDCSLEAGSIPSYEAMFKRFFQLSDIPKVHLWPFVILLADI